MTNFQRRCLLVNMPFTKDKILIKNLFELKGYNARYLVKRDFQKKLKCQKHLKVVAIAYGLQVGRPSSRQWQMTLILLTNWCYTKMTSREIIIICILYLIV